MEEKYTDGKNFLLLQINDALFPIGGYSHSYGLETYIQREYFDTEEKLVEYLHNRLKYSVLYTELLGARLAYENAHNIESLEYIDEMLTASKAPREVREASAKLGSRFIKTLLECKLELENSWFEKYANVSYTKAYIQKNHSTAYGVICAAAKISCEDMIHHYLYSQCSAMITNCVKGVPLSQSIGQRILYECFPVMSDIEKKVFILTKEDLCISMPAFDISCIVHETLYSRLFMS